MSQVKQEAPKIPDVKVADLPLVACSCGGTIYVQASQLRRVSPLLSPTKQEEYLVENLNLICVKCQTKVTPPKREESSLITPA